MLAQTLSGVQSQFFFEQCLSVGEIFAYAVFSPRTLRLVFKRADWMRSETLFP